MKKVIKIGGYDAQQLSISRKGDGSHRVVKLVHEGEPIVLKCYGLKRTLLQTVYRRVISSMLGLKSSTGINTRYKTERETLALWKKEGFDVPEMLFPPLLTEIPQLCLAMEWIPGQTLAQAFKCEKTSLEHKQLLMKNFVGVMAKRHARALELREPRLLFEHPTFKHILISEDRLVHFDFETVFSSRVDMDRIVNHEIAGFLYSLARSNRQHSHTLVDMFLNSYPDFTRIERVIDDLRRYGCVPIVGWLENFQKLFMLVSRYRKTTVAVRAFNHGLLHNSRLEKKKEGMLQSSIRER